MNYTALSYNALIEDLFKKHPTVQNKGFIANAYKPGLDGMLMFDNALGHPWSAYPSIHIAGTNGKGSVSSMLAAALSAKGLRVGLYTSPHLVDFRERIKIIEDGSFSMIPKNSVWNFLVGRELEGLSFFEITTGMAFSWFAEQKVDIAVIETGLGGRLDSTNIITPELSIITSIGLDHCSFLGNTRAEIAKEKAGIFKSGVPALVAIRDEDTQIVFEEKAAQIHCPLFFGDDFQEELFDTDLKGPYQGNNLHTTLAALELLGIDVDEAVKNTVLNTAGVTGLRGRWERLQDSPEVICDIGHNPSALEINFNRLEDMNRPLFIVYGVMADKDITSIRQEMPMRAKYFLVAPEIPRSLPTESLAKVMQGLDYTICKSVSEGVMMARESAEKVENGLVYVGGSNFVVAECILHLY